mmetsp:Transcript_1628/g.4584  ORF Transcript_1628/g.4584 Transcript_1628/m.4584 type:complete len:363 (+) Transcript_1628:480-1568(+)
MLSAIPFRPKRPVRPTRCRYVSGSGMPPFMTGMSYWMTRVTAGTSIPRERTLVVMRIRDTPAWKSLSTLSRFFSSMRPWSEETVCPFSESFLVSASTASRVSTKMMTWPASTIPSRSPSRSSLSFLPSHRRYNCFTWSLKMYLRLMVTVAHAASPPMPWSVRANLTVSSFQVAEKKRVWRLGARSILRIRFVLSPWDVMSISSASSSTKTLIADVSSTLMPMREETLPAVPITIWSFMVAPRSHRSSRRMHLTVIPVSCSRYLPIFITSVEICTPSSRVGQRQSACGFASAGSHLRSIPRTKQAVLPVPLCDCASRLRPFQILGREMAWMREGRTKFISYRPCSSDFGSSSCGSSNLLIVTE